MANGKTVLADDVKFIKYCETVGGPCKFYLVVQSIQNGKPVLFHAKVSEAQVKNAVVQACNNVPACKDWLESEIQANE